MEKGEGRREKGEGRGDFKLPSLDGRGWGRVKPLGYAMRLLTQPTVPPS